MKIKNLFHFNDRPVLHYVCCCDARLDDRQLYGTAYWDHMRLV